MAQMIECLPNKHKPRNSNPSTPKGKIKNPISIYHYNLSYFLIFQKLCLIHSSPIWIQNSTLMGPLEIHS
jgi:hypothetical protein